MKKILITGKNSYIGMNVRKWLEKDDYIVEELDMQNEEWKKADFSKYDVVFHVAGIAHVSSDPQMEKLYYSVNRDLAIETAKKANKQNVKKFIFMSSMIIYGKDAPINKVKIIDSNTSPNPENFYGDSKLQADLEIQKMNSDDFSTVVIRTPMVYGPNCKGNFPRLKKIAKMSPLFPNIENQRSMIYIDNLCEFIKQIIEDGASGVYYPQNKEYMSTKEIIKILAEEQGKKVYFTKLFNPLIKLLSMKVNIINKVFGNKVYSKDISGNYDYIVVENEESIRRSV